MSRVVSLKMSPHLLLFLWIVIWVEEELASPMVVGVVSVLHACHGSALIHGHSGLVPAYLPRKGIPPCPLEICVWSLTWSPEVSRHSLQPPYLLPGSILVLHFFQPLYLPGGSETLRCVPCTKLESASHISGPVTWIPSWVLVPTALEVCWTCAGPTKGCLKHLHFPGISYPLSLSGCSWTPAKHRSSPPNLQQTWVWLWFGEQKHPHLKP